MRPGGELFFLRGSTLRILCAPDEGKTTERLARPQRGLYKLVWDDDDPGVEFHPGMAEMLAILRTNGFELLDFRELFAPEDASDHEFYDDPPAEWAKQWPAEEIWRLRLHPPLILASTSPRRREILEQLRIPFDVVVPRYEEGSGDPVKHAVGKARSVGAFDDRPVLGCDTEVICGGRVFGKPENEADAEEMLDSLAGKTHEVISGLTLLTPAWEEVHREVTLVTFRPLDARDLAHYVASGEWEGRAGGYAIQGLGASLVQRIEGDYLNVVGLPGALLVRLLAQRFPGVYGFG